ncbi:CpsD/CapB family tyrosine-protein kinase [Devosia sp. A8/3-2]|nr:CpsD/CapB family tyrosine-protein kinase [Devosia sp. A8/3-2]
MISTDQALRRVRGDDLSDAASIIMVTSANAGEGKTTVAVSLARSYAISGQSTILIDADLRRPAVHKELGLEPSDALADYLASAGTPGDDIAPLMLTDDLSKAKFIIGSNIRGAAAGRVVSGERFAKLLNSASRLFDVVIVDTPGRCAGGCALPRPTCRRHRQCRALWHHLPERGARHAARTGGSQAGQCRSRRPAQC